MAHGAPDDANIVKQRPVYRLDDLAELAARLGSPVSFDRRGDWLFHDRFDGGLGAWATDYAGTGSEVYLVARLGVSGGYAVYLNAGTVSDFYAHIEHRWPFMQLGPLGLECRIAFNAYVDNVILRVEAFTGSQQRLFKVRIDVDGGAIDYWDGDPDWVSRATGLSLQTTTSTPHVAKLVVDQEEGEYVRFLLDGTEYSLASIAGEVATDNTPPYGLMRIRNEGLDTGAGILIVDDVILTQNEP